MKHHIFILFSSLIILQLLGCGFSTEKRRPAAIEEEYQKRSVKILSEAEILNKAEKLGDSVSANAQKILMGQLVKKIEEGSYQSAVDFCAKNAIQITDSIGAGFQVGLSRVSLKNRNPQNRADTLERDLLIAYEYASEQGAKLSSNLQFYSKKDSVLYNKPIFIPSALCLNCHGKKANIDQETLNAIQKNYPNDKAHGFSVGDFRGLWSVRMSKKQLIQEL